jgi:hypothetical protein
MRLISIVPSRVVHWIGLNLIVELFDIVQLKAIQRPLRLNSL